jgi:chlorobactene glucosyltransferase
MSASSTERPPLWLVLDTALVAAGAAYAFYLLADRPPEVMLRHEVGEGPLGGPDVAASWPFVSIIVPARNEERNLPTLLPSLLNQTYPADRYEVIVVDDQSTDDTPGILAEAAARDPRLRVLRGAPLPAGWKGKPHAMVQGAAVAKGEWLLFTDADTLHHPAALVSAIADAYAHQADLYTINPDLIMGSIPERLIMPIAAMGIAATYSTKEVNDPRSPIAIANGQFILVRRSVYDAVGGIAAVRSEIAEDQAFGKLVKRQGYRLYLTIGTELMRVRMYTNLPEVWEGWGKNVVLSMRSEPFNAVRQLAALATGGVLPFLLTAWYGLRLLQATEATRPRLAWSFALSAAQIIPLLLLKRRVDTWLGLPLGWTFSYPVGMGLFTLILLNSVRRLLTGQGVTWKGRSYKS